MHWNNGERADVFLGPVMITLFTRAIYEDEVDLPPEGLPAPRAVHRRSRRRARGPRPSCGARRWSRARSGSAASRSSRRRAASASSSWSSWRTRHEGDALPPRVGERQRHPVDEMVDVLPRRPRPRRRTPARHSRHPRALAPVGDQQLHLVGAPPSGQAASTPLATTTALPSTTSTPPSPSSRRAASNTSAVCKARASSRSGSPTRPATRSNYNRRPAPDELHPVRPPRPRRVHRPRSHLRPQRARVPRQPRRRSGRARRPERGTARGTPTPTGPTRRRSRRRRSSRRAASRSTRSRRCCRSRCTSTA